MKIAGHRADTKELRTRIFVLGAAVLAGLAVLAINSYRLMVVRYDEFLALSVDNQFKDVRIRAERGLIKDRRGNVLVDSRPSFDVFITPAFCLRCSADVIPLLAEVLEWDTEQQQRIAGMVKSAHGPQRFQPMVAQVDLPQHVFDMLKARQFMLPGVDIEAVPHRNYRTGPALAHILGFMNEVTPEELARLNSGKDTARPPYAMGDYTGRRGVERSFEHVLRGKDGWVKEVVDARGQMIKDGRGGFIRGEEVASTAGANVITSIDARLQEEAERVFPGQAGSIVVLDARTGFLLAVVSRPSFDPNELTGRVSPKRLAQLTADPLQPLVFRAAAEHYHPGSTFKVIPLITALQSGAFTPQSSTVCTGAYHFGGRSWRCHKDSGHGTVQARTAIQWSCDSYFYKIADVLGIDAIARVGKLFGLGSTTNLGVAAEVPGVMPDTEYHNKFTPGGYTKGLALNTAIGQGDVNVTPLQLAVTYAAIGNGGKVFQPQVVTRIETPDGKVLQSFDAKVVRTVPMTDEQHHVLVDALTAVVNEPGGTAFRSRMKDVVIAGKTGTAQVAKLGATRLKKEEMDYFERDHAWFAAFAPADNPEIAVVSLNEHGGHGGSDAAPAAAAVIAKYFELKKNDSEAFGPGFTPPAPHVSPETPTRPMTPVDFKPSKPATAVDSKPPPLPVAKQAAPIAPVPAPAIQPVPPQSAEPQQIQ